MWRRSSRGSARRAGACSAITTATLIILSPLAARPVLAQAAADSGRFEELFWESVVGSDDSAQYAAYLARFPNGAFAELARLKIAALDRRARPPAAPVSNVVPVAPAPVLTADSDLSTFSNADLLANAASQVNKPYAAPDAVARALPQAPTLPPVPRVVFPARFCSTAVRNDFYETIYKAAKAVSDENNRLAIEHSHALQRVYDRFAAERDELAMTAISREATAYQIVAEQAFRESKDMVALYPEMMKVPIGKCR